MHWHKAIGCGVCSALQLVFCPPIYAEDTPQRAVSAPPDAAFKALFDSWTASDASGYGNLVVLDHGGGIETRYGHLSEITVAVGQLVHRGDVIGRVGSTGRSTGSHLHYEIRLSSQAIDPLPFLAPGDERLTLHQAVGPRAGAATAMGGPRQSPPCPK